TADSGEGNASLISFSRLDFAIDAMIASRDVAYAMGPAPVEASRPRRRDRRLRIFHTRTRRSQLRRLRAAAGLDRREPRSTVALVEERRIPFRRGVESVDSP